MYVLFLLMIALMCIFHLQLFDTKTLDVMKTFKTERPVNSAAISPTKPHVSAMS